MIRAEPAHLGQFKGMIVDGDPALALEDAVNDTCPWSGGPVAAEALTLYQGAVVGFADAEARDRFEAAIRHFEDALQARRMLTAGNSE